MRSRNARTRRMSVGLGSAGGLQLAVLVGQIVLSVTALSSVKEVRLARNRQPVEDLLADGALTAEPLTAADYAALR